MNRKDITQLKLKNGACVILAPMRQQPNVAIYISIPIGSKHDPKGRAGIAHLAEHLIYEKGTPRRPTPKEIHEELDDIGGGGNASTGRELTSYYLKTASGNLERAFDLLSDMFLNATIPAHQIEKEKRIIAQERRMDYDDPSERVWDIYSEILYGDQPAGRLILGTDASVAAITRADLLRFRNKHYIGRNTLIVVAGGFSQKEVTRIIKRYFSARKGTPSAMPRTKESQRAPVVRVEPRSIKQTNIALGFRTVGFLHPARRPLGVLGTVMGALWTSILREQVREKSGLAYSISASSANLFDHGRLSVGASLDSQQFIKALRIISECIRETKKRISPISFRRAIESITYGLSLNTETSDDLASFITDYFWDFHKLVLPEDEIRAFRAVTLADVQRAARTYLVPERANLALVGPKQDTRELIKIMKTL